MHHGMSSDDGHQYSVLKLWTQPVRAVSPYTMLVDGVYAECHHVDHVDMYVDALTGVLH